MRSIIGLHPCVERAIRCLCESPAPVTCRYRSSSSRCKQMSGRTLLKTFLLTPALTATRSHCAGYRASCKPKTANNGAKAALLISSSKFAEATNGNPFCRIANVAVGTALRRVLGNLDQIVVRITHIHRTDRPMRPGPWRWTFNDGDTVATQPRHHFGERDRCDKTQIQRA